MSNTFSGMKNAIKAGIKPNQSGGYSTILLTLEFEHFNVCRILSI